MVCNKIHDLAQEKFEAKRATSAIAIAARVVVNRYDLRTAPSVTEIATHFEITAHELRVAGARSGLTSIDRMDTKTRWRERSEAYRRANGSRPQSEMNMRAEDIRLASLVGCTDRTIRTRRIKGDLPAYLKSKGIDFPHSSLPKDSYEETKLGSLDSQSKVIDMKTEITFAFGKGITSNAIGIVPEHAHPTPFQGEEARPICAALAHGR